MSYSHILKLLFIHLFLVLYCFVNAQKAEKIPFFEKAPTFNQKRFWIVAGIGTATYTGTMIALNEAWYAGYERSKFHLFDDRGEWLDMDKAGHTFSAYNESRVFFEGARWMGISHKNSVLVAFGAGTVLQASIEILDGFSEKWGFSIADIGANTAGCLLFAGQEWAWQEQRITMRGSFSRKSYSNAPILATNGVGMSDLRTHTDNLFGAGPPTVFLKDYNAQTVWFSANVYSFLNKKETNFPKWLNVAVGYGAQNIFGGYGNTWSIGEDSFHLSEADYPRYRQFYLSLDVDWTKIKTKNGFLRSLLRLANMVKIPSPTLEFNTLGKVKFHPVYF